MEIVKNFTQSKLVRNLFIALIGSILLAISSKIKIPFYPVPMTMQTFVVLIIGIGYFCCINNWYWIWMETWCFNYNVISI